MGRRDSKSLVVQFLQPGQGLFAAAVVVSALAGLQPVAAPLPAAAAEPPAQPVPFVGCAGDGQDGPVAALSITGQPPRLPPDQASSLAYYAFHAVGVFAPQGWHCFGVYGSAGETLFVTPDTHGSADLLTGTTKLHGPAVVIQRMSGDTSGRFEVAKLAARLFPVAKPYVRDVIAEGIEPDTDFDFAPYPADTVHLVSTTVAEFTTPAGSEGLGTQASLAPADQPIIGAALWLPSETHDMVLLTTRLPPDQSAMVRTIVMQVERTNGSPKPGGRGN